MLYHHQHTPATKRIHCYTNEDPIISPYTPVKTEQSTYVSYHPAISLKSRNVAVSRDFKKFFQCVGHLQRSCFNFSGASSSLPHLKKSSDDTHSFSTWPKNRRCLVIIDISFFLSERSSLDLLFFHISHIIGDRTC